MASKSKIRHQTLFSSLMTLILLFGPSFLVYAQDANTIVRDGDTQRVGISKRSPRFILDLEYSHAFQISVTGEKTPFCKVNPSKVSNTLRWEGEIDTTGDVSFDNVLYYNNYYFVLDSLTLTIYAFKDIKDKTTFVTIKSSFSNKPQENGEFDETFFTIDETNGVLFVVTKKIMLSYPLTPFYDAIKSKAQVPELSKFPDNMGKYTSIEIVRFYQNNLYVVADNLVYIWYSAKNGDLASVNQKFDGNFFSVTAFSATDIAFYDHYALILDAFNGVYVVDLKMAAQQIFTPVGLKIDIKKGEFIQIVQSSVNIISATTKSTILYEYAIVPNNTLTIVYNRQQEIFQSVSDMVSDGNFLYVITGFFNEIVRPGVPSRFDSVFVRNYISDFWPLYHVDAMYTIKKEAQSEMIVIQGKLASLYVFEAQSPILICRIADVPVGEYEVELSVYETTCLQKMIDPKRKNDFNTTCLSRDSINLFITDDDSSLGNLSKTGTTKKELITGIVAMLVLVLIFACLICKYKKGYNRLEEQFKFIKLKEVDAEGQGNSENNNQPRSDRE